MMHGSLLFGFAFLLQRFTGSWAIEIDVTPREATVLPDQNVTFLCRVPVPLQYCRIQIPGLKPYNLNNNLSTGGVSYYGTGLNNGQCGFTIDRVIEKYNGEITCSLGITGEPQESSGSMQLIVAKAPKTPELDISRGSDALNVYKINDILYASCSVRDGRPVANISWHLDDEPMYADELSMPIITTSQDRLYTITQNFSRQLRASDNGKSLICVGRHPGYPNGYSSVGKQLDIKYPPQPQGNPIEIFGFTIGQPGTISIELSSNPKPHIEWTVRGQKISEGNTDPTGRIAATAPTELGKGRYQVNLTIPAITKQDTETQYVLYAYNDMGNQEYYVQISTMAEPEGLNLGVGSIIAIVAAILIILLIVFVVLFARITGRWCFSGGTRVIDYTGGESGDHHSVGQDGIPGDGIDNPHHQTSQEYINGNDLPVKKKDEKINTPV